MHSFILGFGDSAEQDTGLNQGPEFMKHCCPVRVRGRHRSVAFPAFPSNPRSPALYPSRQRQLHQCNLFISPCACALVMHGVSSSTSGGVCNFNFNTEPCAEALLLSGICVALRRVCTSPFCEAYIQSFLQPPTAVPAPTLTPTPTGRAALSVHTAPRCSGENRSSCLPRRETAGLQVLNILFEEEVVGGSPESLTCLHSHLQHAGEACFLVSANTWHYRTFSFYLYEECLLLSFAFH